jgi:hypothetical protein
MAMKRLWPPWGRCPKGGRRIEEGEFVAKSRGKSKERSEEKGRQKGEWKEKAKGGEKGRREKEGGVSRE